MNKLIFGAFVGAVLAGYMFKRYIDNQLSIDIKEYIEKNS